MIVVIFRARIADLDDDYFQTAARLRDLAFDEFGCCGFHSLNEGDQEITLSYWSDEDAVRAWKAHPEHVAAQQRGKERWYASYTVQVAEVRRQVLAVR